MSSDTLASRAAVVRAPGRAAVDAQQRDTCDGNPR
jgi:hypothetical protein